MANSRSKALQNGVLSRRTERGAPMEKCKACIHEKVCALWRAQECQDASCYAEDENGDCDYFQDKSRFVQVPHKVFEAFEQTPGYLANLRTITHEGRELYLMGNWQEGEGQV